MAGYLFTAQSGSTPATGNAAIVLNAAATAMEADHRDHGGYALTERPAGVTVARADAQGYCVEAFGMHLAGPGGSPEPGGC